MIYKPACLSKQAGKPEFSLSEGSGFYVAQIRPAANYSQDLPEHLAREEGLHPGYQIRELRELVVEWWAFGVRA